MDPVKYGGGSYFYGTEVEQRVRVVNSLGKGYEVTKEK